MTNIYITTTGATPSVILNDLGYRVLVHPIVDYNIGSEFTYNELISSVDFNNSLDLGYLTASYNGSLINNSYGFEPVIGAAQGFGSTGPTGPAGATGSNGQNGATGPAGATGSNGQNGATGPAGATGSDGQPGATGPAGATGSPFLNGLTASLQFLTASNDTNVVLNILSSGSTHSFNVSWNGVLPISRGGSGTSSTFTPGSVIFAGPGGLYYQDNPNFFWNDSLNRLAIGTNSTATASLTIADSVQIGFGLTSGTLAATNELVLRQDGDTFGSSILRLRNRNGENGAIYETTDPSITLVDFIFKSAINQRNIRFESRTASTFLGISPEFQFGPAANPSLVVNDREVNVRSGTFSISNSAKTFEYQFTPSDITADRRIILPLLTSNDTLITSSASQTLTNKIFSGGTISGVTISSSTILSNDNIVEATRLQTFTISTATPSTNNILSWSGVEWTPISNNIVGSTGPTGPAGTMNTLSITASTATTTTTTFPNLMTGVQIGGLTAGNYLVFFGAYCTSPSGAITTTRVYTQTTGAAIGITHSSMIFQRGSQTVNATHNYSGYPVSLNATGTVSIHWTVSTGTGVMNNPYLTIIRR